MLASDIPTLREAGGLAVTFAPVGDVGAWADAVIRIIATPASAPSLVERLAWSAQFTWVAHAETIARAYYKFL